MYYIYKEKFEDNYFKDKKYCKVRYYCHYVSEYRGTTRSIYNLKYSVPKEIIVIVHNVSNYGYHFIMKSWQKNLKDN